MRCRDKLVLMRSDKAPEAEMEYKEVYFELI